MLSPDDPLLRGRRRRYALSPRQEYDEYVMQRVESYKNGLSRSDLMALAERATLTRGEGTDDQFVLTEVLVQQWVDEAIKKELGLTSFRRWNRKVVALREAQRQPTHWDVPPDGPVARLLPRLEPGDLAVVAGARAEGVAGLLTAHHLRVIFLAGDCFSAGRVEDRLEGEALADRLTAYVVAYGTWLPEELRRCHLAVLDMAALAGAGTREASTIVGDLQERTLDGGVHILLEAGSALAPDALRGLYEGWMEDGGGDPGTRRRDLQFTCPTCHTDTDAAISRRVV